MITINDLFRIFGTPVGIHLQKLLIGLLLLVAAVLAAKLVQAIIVYLFDLIRIDKMSDRIGLTTVLKKSGIDTSFTSVCGGLVFWLAALAGGVAIIYAMNFVKALEILRTMLNYTAGSVVNAVFVLILAVILGSLLSGLVLFIGGLIFLPGYKLIARVSQYVVVIYGIVFGLEKLGIPTSVLARPDIILGFFALAGAIAFGLGCKDYAAGWLANFLREK
jgi:hypothetical protein